MQHFKRGLGLALLLFIWVIALFFGAAWIVRLNWIPTHFVGIFQDAFVLFGVWIFNRLVGHVPVQLWSGHHLGQQLCLALPTILIVGLLFAANIGRVLQLPFSTLILLYLGYVLLIGITEEYVFRGVLLPIVARSFPNQPLISILISSAFFGGLHLMNSTHISLTYVLPQILFAMLLGTLFAGIYVCTHNLALPIILHSLTDISVIVQLVKHPSMANLNMPVQTSITVALFYASLLVMAIFWVARQTEHQTIKTEI
ncbi:type II CAAX endopeptidase family protein [Lactiplantibacillus sp. WILCCON 0030]|uniref:Type II CAAX endopeptidase family protein n=1 Tax=Lactiplantibacillus brownii TaxID=3069269 RepID=A0ABU1A5P8_9LACO|nr:type II CAAX endopeptidase family protein [Lactiplantibacillus brownii]MDQ7936296.1 type II CAAX endopeptidase family protein [Lactiplantibacillus brownii]